MGQRDVAAYRADPFLPGGVASPGSPEISTRFFFAPINHTAFRGVRNLLFFPASIPPFMAIKPKSQRRHDQAAAEDGGIPGKQTEAINFTPRPIDRFSGRFAAPLGLPFSKIAPSL